MWFLWFGKPVTLSWMRGNKRRRMDGDDESTSDECTRGGVGIIDALPYVDEYTQEDRALALSLIEVEMQTFDPADYLAHLPPVPAPFNDSDLLLKEMERVSSSGAPLDPMFEPVFPTPPKSDDTEAWTTSCASAERHFEHENIRLLNLELLNQYGGTALKVNNEYLEAMRDRYQGMVDDARADIEALNRTRSEEQARALETLRRRESEWRDLVKHNIRLDGAVSDLESRLGVEGQAGLD